MKKSHFTLLLFLLFFSSLKETFGQDTVTMLQYNLTLFGNPYGCDETTNNTLAKQGYVRIITSYVKPDIFTVNEMRDIPSYANDLLNNSLNTWGVTSYQRATMTNLSPPSSIVNMMYYNTNKFVLYSQDQVAQNLLGSNLVRLIDLYTLYYNDPNLSINHDTVFLTCCVLHLHSSNMTERLYATEALMARINLKGTGNYLVSGDFNVDSYTESAFQELINYSNPAINFNDPINQLGTWNNNPGYAMIHTQSTRLTNTNSGCFSGGGMDDRFDMILASNDVIAGTSGVMYLPGSYQSFGQDGTVFNQEYNATGNAVVPDSISSALYQMSDHLPVLLKMIVGPTVNGINRENAVNYFQISTFVNDKIAITAGTEMKNATIELFDLTGKMLYSETHNFTRAEKYIISTSKLNSGFYIAIISNNNFQSSYKIFKQ